MLGSAGVGAHTQAILSPFMGLVDSMLKLWAPKWLEVTPDYRDASEGG